MKSTICRVKLTFVAPCKLAGQALSVNWPPINILVWNWIHRKKRLTIYIYIYLIGHNELYSTIALLGNVEPIPAKCFIFLSLQIILPRLSSGDIYSKLQETELYFKVPAYDPFNWKVICHETKSIWKEQTSEYHTVTDNISYCCFHTQNFWKWLLYEKEQVSEVLFSIQNI